MNLEDRLREVLQGAERHPAPDFADRVVAALPARRAFVPWPGRIFAAPLAVASVAALLVTALLIGPALVPGPVATPPAASTAVAPTPFASVATYPDGIPRQIGGEPVLRGASIDEHVEEAADDTPFFVAGYVTSVGTDHCPEPTHPLLIPCAGTLLSEDGDGSGPLQRLVAWTGGPPLDTGVVLRVHVLDPLAAECAPQIRQRCEDAIVVEAVVWSAQHAFPLDGDGLPLEVDGQRVLRGPSIARHVQVTATDQSFYVAGWATGPIPPRCATDILPSLVCETTRSIHLLDSPDGATATVVAIFTKPPTPGPVVLRVHVHNATLQALCPPFRADHCAKTLVLEQIVWTGQAASAEPRVGGMRFVPWGKDREFSRDRVER